MSTAHVPSCHQKKPVDYLLWGSLTGILLFYGLGLWPIEFLNQWVWTTTFSQAVTDLVHRMWVGVAIGIVMIALLSKIPREFVISILGKKRGFSGIMRATLAGVLLDLCSHGILMVGSKLYERGATIGQVMAFLVASPWNSFSLTLILISLLGLGWTVAFIGLSLLIGIITGLIFDWLVSQNQLPKNPHTIQIRDDFQFWREARQGLSTLKIDLLWIKDLGVDGLKESRMVMRWVLFGILLASTIQTFVDAHHFQTFFGPSLMGLGLTLLAATVIEVCSEGSAPVAADLLNRAQAPGNSFAFLMTGVATDYTEIMVIKDTTQSWKIALALPLITVPQVLAIAWLLN